jgi:hypothetical protein
MLDTSPKQLGVREILLSAFAAGIAIFVAACSGINGMNTPGGVPAAQTMTQIKIGDDPADRLLAFEVTVGPVSLMNQSGSSVPVLSAPQRVELTHLSGTSQLMSMLAVPQGTYTAATVTFANPEITFLNSSGSVKKIELSTTQTVTINFTLPVTITSASAVIDFDVNLAKLLTFDSNGNVTGVNLSAASFTVNSSDVGPPENQGDDNGEQEDVFGTISAVNGSSFTLTVADAGVQLTFTTDSKTEFEDGASLAVNSMVTVEGRTNSDGSLYAKKIEGAEDERGAEAQGLVIAVAGSPATSLTFVPDDGNGSGMDSAALGTPMKADVTNAKFEVHLGAIDTTGLGNLPNSEFPFDPSTIHAGQRVEIDSKDAMNGSGLVAQKVRLEQQALVGTVSGLGGKTSSGPVTFTLTVPSDSAFATLSGQTMVTVLWQPNTDLKNLTSVGDGDTIRVRGLVFYSGTSSNMIARRITK